MDIALLGSAESLVDIFPMLEKLLRERIMHVNVRSHYAPSTLELPLVAKELMSSNLAFVFVALERETEDLRIAKEKLLELKMQGNFRAELVIGAEMLGESGESEFDSDELARKWCDRIIDRLFHRESLKPGYVPGEAGKKSR